MYVNEVKNNAFYQFPQWLLKEEPYKNLGDKAKMMYMLLFDRRTLSIKNKWYDEDGRIFMIFTNEQFMEELNCSEPAVIKAKKELAKFGLLEEVRQGINKPNRLYINGTKETLGQELNFFKSGTKETLGQELKKVKGINTNNINTNISNNIYTDNKPINFGQFVKAEGLKVNDRHMTRLLEYIGLDGMDMELVKEAVRRTTDGGIDNPSYTFRILDSWKAKGITTVEQANEEKEEFHNQKQRRSYPAKQQPAKSNVPEWVEEEYKHEATADEQAKLDALKAAFLEE
ncbi:DnaD domain protein [Streptococcus equinus]|uniref:DnaD and phage-associated domain-containing protein n=1 Tax=Streptococcus equinus TaxID=1335 RepID=A0A1G9KHG2_STREI|nr:DnaD domain protein [Streptococcus equinus]QBX15847.1 replication initiation protein [Streptococcus phage Javan215]SDL49079.1 DnaD and phage-associated domain-containing protein [Streptococcus equinus]